MSWMNEYEIEEAVARFERTDETPNLLAGATTLLRLMRWTNRNSDGWPYWKLPSNAAKRLMDLLQSADRFDPQDCTAAQLKSAYSPIKAFLTKRGVDHAEVWPPPPPPSPAWTVRTKGAVAPLHEHTVTQENIKAALLDMVLNIDAVERFEIHVTDPNRPNAPAILTYTREG